MPTCLGRTSPPDRPGDLRRRLLEPTRAGTRSRFGFIAAICAASALIQSAAAGSLAPAPASAETITVPVTLPRAATLTGDLQLPSGQGPHPAVILLHGCAGINASVASWARWLRGEGYATLELDSLGGRSLTTVCLDSRPLSMTNRAGDVFAAAAEMKKIAAIDAGRIAALGFSHGGGTAIVASGSGARHPEASVRAFVALWPGCGTGMPIGPAPVLMLLGGKDDWTPPEACQALAGAARATGNPVEVVVYPDAGHGFGYAHLRDLRGPTPGRVVIPGARGGRGATMEYNPSAHADAEKRVSTYLAGQLRK